MHMGMGTANLTRRRVFFHHILRIALHYSYVMKVLMTDYAQFLASTRFETSEDELLMHARRLIYQ